MTLTDIFSVIDCFNFTLVHLTEIVLSELVGINRAVVNLVATEVVVGHSVLRNSLLLLNNLLGARLAHTLQGSFLAKEFVVLVCGGPVVHALLETHSEVGHSH